MRLLVSGVILCLFHPSSGGWLRDIFTPKGWHLGDGFILHLTNSRYPNTTFLERYSIMMDYSGYGVSVTKIPQRRALEVDLYTPQFGEVSARGEKSNAFSLIIGYKIATLAAIAFSAVGAIALKALIVGKIAAVTSLILIVSKLFYGKENEASPQYMELDDLPELYVSSAELPPEVAYYPGGYQSYTNIPGGIDYAAVEISGSNSTLPDVSSNQQVARRRDATKRRKLPLVTIHQYSNS